MNSMSEYYIAKMEDSHLKVYKLTIEDDMFDSKLKPFSVQGLSGDYSDFFMYGEDIVSKNVEKLRGFVGFRNRICT